MSNLSFSCRTAALLASAGLVGLVAASGAAQAQSTGLAPIKFGLSNGGSLTLYGQVNKGIAQYDDGEATRSYGLVDNANSNTRFGLRYDQKFGDWAFQNVNEFAYAPYSTSDVNINTPNPNDYAWSNSNIRKIDFTLAQDGYGKFWAGQGSMATDGISEIDLSGTDVIAYSSVGDSASAQLLRFSDGTLSNIQIQNVFKNQDGDRRVRFRYDTPSFANFTFAAAFGRNLLSSNPDARDANLFDAAVRYKNTFNDTIDFQAGVGYNWRQGFSGGEDTNTWSGSASAIHSPSGVNFTLAAGTGETTAGDNANFWYAKLGLLRGFFGEIGKTGMSIDYYDGTDFNLDTEAGITNSDSKSWGVAFVQNIDKANTQLWLTWRNYQFSDSTSSFDDGNVVFGGARFKF